MQHIYCNLNYLIIDLNIEFGNREYQYLFNDYLIVFTIAFKGHVTNYEVKLTCYV